MQLSSSNDTSIDIRIATNYLRQQSTPENNEYVFSYTISITNNGDAPAQLMSRRWIITDANGDESYVEGEGVVGKQPLIGPGETHTYTSGSVFKTPIGTMHGQYQMKRLNGETFWANIPVFRLSVPNILN
ncbi:Co2+/Mg2+ efflux protein ApaG [Thalassotalea euphylliae]|uniref:Co2+/Mg2+ efflux protein ApaG n=1 Tax=Thalassotalea euphylliae TaxID=1655234 RepID=UPI00363205F0